MNVINFHLTNACNYNCTYCFGKFPDKKELTFEQACAVIDSIANYFLQNSITNGRINLAGGEPLLCLYIDDLINYINAYGIKVSIITNGSLLTKEQIARWKNKVYCIGLSLDSASTEINTAIGRCCKQKTLTLRQAISITQAIHRNGIRLKINTVVSKLNVSDNMTEFYKRLKPDRLKFLQVEIVKGVNDNSKQLEISKKDFKRFCVRHKNCCAETIIEYSDDMENSYLMINPQGELQLNNHGGYQVYGNCLKEDINLIINRTPINRDKFDLRYQNRRKFPQNDKQIYIFGGHETWHKIIKEHYINAKFYKDNDLYDLNIIRNADEIWIQPNAISHSFYKKVIDTARKNGIPVHYFAYAGTKKCLEQIAL